jgi:indole-3-glycerol phosphate synthase
VLLIARMLDDPMLDRLCDAAACAGLFVLLEAFDRHDLERAGRVADRWHPNAPPLWVGVNTRDLASLQVDPGRLADLADLLPHGVPCVAESGIRDGRDAAEVRRLGYQIALVGSALMSAPDPGLLLRELLEAGRAVVPGPTLH